MGQAKPVKLRSAMTTAYTLTSSFADVTGLVLPPVEIEGWYDISSCFTFRANASADDCLAGIFIDGNKINGTINRAVMVTGSIGTWPWSINSKGIYLKKEEVVSIQAKYTTAGGAIQYLANQAEGFIEAEWREY